MIYARQVGYSEVEYGLVDLEGWQVLERTSRASFLSIATAISFLIIQPPAMAAVTADQVTNAINKAKILAPGTQMKVRVQGEQASISTFRNERADDKDSKIDALLLGKTVFEIPGSGITSIVVYFYSTRAANEYRAVTIRSGDVKAFDSGAMGQDELLSSIEIKSGKVQDTATAIESRMMLSAAARRDFQTVDRGEEIEVSCKMPQLSDDEYKYEAYKIASTALDFIGSNSAAKRIMVTFYDPAEKGKFKQVVISLNNIATIQKQVAAAFGSMQLNQGVSKLTSRDIDVSEGPLQAERTALLARIRGLEEKGVGVAPFLSAYQGIDGRASTADPAVLSKEIQRLDATISDQEKAYASAKTLKFSKGEEKTSAAKPGREVAEPKEPKSQGKVSRWALGFFPLIATNIIRDPEGYLADCKRKFEAEAKKPAEDDPRYMLALMWFSEVLKANNFPEDAKKYESQARTLEARFKTK
jgi:hypothetical protein